MGSCLWLATHHIFRKFPELLTKMGLSDNKMTSKSKTMRDCYYLVAHCSIKNKQKSISTFA